MRDREQSLTETEISLMIHGTDLRAKCLESRGHFKEAELAFVDSANIAMSLGKLGLYFSIEFERIELLNKVQKFKDAHALVYELSIKLEQLKDNLDGQMYEGISRRLQSLLP